MASFNSVVPSFEKDTPVLRLTRGKDKDARWVLWPVFVWRVVAPVPKVRTLNLFQRGVLGLARASVVRLAEVADRLLIAPDLAGLVVLELQGMGLVDHAGLPTPRGVRVLEDIEEDSPDDVRVGHVLSDPFTGKLWPRFLTGDLPLADVELDDDGRPLLLSGSAGDPWRDRAFSVLPGVRDVVVAAKPSAYDVLRAARRHRRQRDYDDVNDARDVPRLERVSLVDDQPQPYLLALRVRRHKSGDWMVDDPFGHGEAVDLRARLEERIDSYSGLRKWLAPLIGTDPSTPLLGQLHAEAIWMVEERLTLDIRRHGVMCERLVAMQRALLEATLEDAPRDKWDDVVVKAQKAVERLLHIVQLPYLDSGVSLFRLLARSDKEFNHRHFNAIADGLGFTTPLPEGLSAVRRGKVENAEGRMRGGLQPILLVALLWADRDQDHPLRVAAKHHPDLLHRLHELAAARDRFAAHDGADLWPKTVPQHIETVFLAVETLLFPIDKP